jgi:beta-phosphoglucomutase family hydrolase
MYGLPESIRGCLFDLDGVLTDTAGLHAEAWKATLDAVLCEAAARTHRALDPFDEGADYRAFVDGKPREDGVRDFLTSRGIHLPEGRASDPPDVDTVSSVARRKRDLMRSFIRNRGVRSYPGTVRFLAAVRVAGLATAVVSSSTNCTEMLAASGLGGQFDVMVDGLLAHRLGLSGKPAPDTFLRAANLLGLEPREACVFEDALAGVKAGRAGGFGFVVGVDRGHGSAALISHGADIAVADLGDLLR